MLNPWKDRKAEAGPETEEDIEKTPGGAPAEAFTEGREGAGADADGEGSDSDGEGADGAGRGDGGDGGSAGDRAGGQVADAASLEAELAELKDRHLRLAAEFENFRKRTRKEAAVGRTMAQAELAREILPTLDDLARVADMPHESTTVQALDEGIELILRNFRKQLADVGLERVHALDERFDPERHQAVMTTAVDDPDLDETISRVLVDGYEFLGRLVRPAQVEVRRYEEPAAGADEA